MPDTNKEFVEELNRDGYYFCDKCCYMFKSSKPNNICIMCNHEIEEEHEILEPPCIVGGPI